VEDFDPDNTTKTAQDQARFTFRGEPKPAFEVPETVPTGLGDEVTPLRPAAGAC